MKKIWARILILILAFTVAMSGLAAADTAPQTKAKTSAQTISIVFSHDMHSHLEKFAKLRTVIKTQKRANKATFVLDAGDFSMGTPYQTIYKKEASELRTMGAVGYDVTTLGNHEFDYRSKGLATMLNNAKASKDKLPQMVISNIDWDGTLADKDLAEDGQNLKQALENYGAKDYTVVERGGARIAVFGIFGKESASYAPESGTLFSDPIETARKIVKKIKEEETADLIVCVSHSGTNQDDPESSEDEILAKEVDGIDLIVSGHSHTEFAEPLIENDTVIASVGQYNDNIGTLSFTKKDGKFQFDTYKLMPLDRSIKDNENIAALIDEYKELVNKQYFIRFGYEWDDVLTRNTVDFTTIDIFGLDQGEDTLGNLVADSYRYGVKKAEGGSGEDVNIAVVPAGVIRGSFDKGKITAADAFNALSLGTGKDGIAGYPLVSVYLTGKELKMAAEIDISVSEFMQPARLYFSGLSYTYNPHRIILDRAYDIKLNDKSGKKQELNDDKLYRVVADLYSAQMLGTVNSMSYGLLSVTPKDKDGEEIANFEDHIIYNQDGSELKEWHALASYLNSFQGGKVPEYYAEKQDRKILESSKNIIDILKNPNRFFWMMLAALILVLTLIALVIVLIVNLVWRIKYGKGGRKKRKRQKQARLFS